MARLSHVTRARLIQIMNNANGHPVKYGTGVSAAQEVYAQAAVKK